MIEILDLIDKINNYNGSIEELEALINIICEISDDKNSKNEWLMEELLFIASQKLRIFGYNHMNNISNIHNENYYDSGGELFKLQNTIVENYYTTQSGVLLDKFQKDIVDLYMNLDSKRIMVSAPTSFGKTFILREIIYMNKEKYKNILLIFPTVSLINENFFEFKEFIHENDLSYNIINNTHKELRMDEQYLFILTPERVIKIMNDNPDLNFDFFFLDEVYKIDNFFTSTDSDMEIKESERDTVFRVVLYLLIKKVKDFYLAGPYIKLNEMQIGLKTFIERYSVAYKQIDIELIKKEHIPAWTSIMKIQGFKYRFESRNKIPKLFEIMDFIYTEELGQTLIYGESKSKITQLAREASNKFETFLDSGYEELEVFINHLISRYSLNYKTVEIHDYWTMITSLRKGIGIHHGSFPKYIQNEILSLYNKGIIKFIFSTTSITEGVNTKAKNVIFYGKKKGTKQLKKFDIKNINGRAGRYYHHFKGRVFYLEKDVFDRLNQDEEGLDFITFSNKELSPVDIDNSYYEDLSPQNAVIKEEREKQIIKYNIDESVFYKNRLVDKLSQIKLIKKLEQLTIMDLRYIVESCSSIRRFLENHIIYLMK